MRQALQQTLPPGFCNRITVCNPLCLCNTFWLHPCTDLPGLEQGQAVYTSTLLEGGYGEDYNGEQPHTIQTLHAMPVRLAVPWTCASAGCQSKGL